ncbi:MAG: transporter [Chlorobiaceae bacterium]|nr:transporter [Chlorobiaceae bacterium]NTW74391.1 transporter [Chlorobiaceae bacterium]
MKKQVLALAVAAVCFSTPAFAAHPLITDDTGTQGKGRFQLELNSEFATDRENEAGISVKKRGGELATMVSYGLGDRVDLVAGLPWLWSRLKEDGVVTADEEGIGDLSIELKWRFFEASKNGISLALKPGITLPTGDEAKGLGNGEISGGVMLIATHESEGLKLHANTGYTRSEYRLDADKASNRNDIWHASLAAELDVAEKLRAVANAGVETNGDKGSHTHPAFLLGGLIYSVTEAIDLDLGIKGGLNKAETDTALLAGMAVRF